MNPIPEVCRTPGFIFKNAVYEGPVLPDDHRIRIQYKSFEGVGILGNKYCPPNMRLERNKAIKDLVVIGYDEKQVYLAKENYMDDLMKFYYYNNKYLKSIRFPHLENDWMRACSKDEFNDSFRLSGKKGRIKGHRWFEVKGPKSSMMIQELQPVNVLKGQPIFFPDSFYNQYLPRSLYKDDGIDIDLPIYYSGDAKFKNDKKNVHIFLHGFPSPVKWHYGVWKHVLCLPTVGKQSDQEYWDAFDGKKVHHSQLNVFKNCRENKNRTSCDEDYCRKNELFSCIHPNIREYCHRYLNRAISFFESDSSKEIQVWTNDTFTNLHPRKIKVCITNKNKKDKRVEKLILKGYSYDWEKVDHPTMHLFILTLYAGRLHPNSKKNSGFENGELINFGQLNIIR